MLPSPKLVYLLKEDVIKVVGTATFQNNLQLALHDIVILMNHLIHIILSEQISGVDITIFQLHKELKFEVNEMVIAEIGSVAYEVLVSRSLDQEVSEHVLLSSMIRVFYKIKTHEIVLPEGWELIGIRS